MSLFAGPMLMWQRAGPEQALRADDAAMNPLGIDDRDLITSVSFHKGEHGDASKNAEGS